MSELALVFAIMALAQNQVYLWFKSHYAASADWQGFWTATLFATAITFAAFSWAGV